MLLQGVEVLLANFGAKVVVCDRIISLYPTTPFPPEDYRKVCRGAGERLGAPGEKLHR